MKVLSLKKQKRTKHIFNVRKKSKHSEEELAIDFKAKKYANVFILKHKLVM